MSDPSDPIEILKQRFAKGEIDAETYHSSLDVLQAKPSSTSAEPEAALAPSPQSTGSAYDRDEAFKKAMYDQGYSIDPEGRVSIRENENQKFTPIAGGKVDHFSWPAAILNGFLFAFGTYGVLLVVKYLFIWIAIGTLSADSFLGILGFIRGLTWIVPPLVFVWTLYASHRLYQIFASARDAYRLMNS
jgi:hypothetical protein